MISPPLSTEQVLEAMQPVRSNLSPLKTGLSERTEFWTQGGVELQPQPNQSLWNSLYRSVMETQ